MGLHESFKEIVVERSHESGKKPGTLCLGKSNSRDLFMYRKLK
jgi:hypothetical protein